MRRILPKATLLGMLSMSLNDLLHLVVAPQKDAGPVMYMFRYHSKHTFHTTVHGLAASCAEKSTISQGID